MAILMQNGKQLGYSAADANAVNYTETDGSKKSVQTKINELSTKVGTKLDNYGTFLSSVNAGVRTFMRNNVESSTMSITFTGLSTNEAVNILLFTRNHSAIVKLATGSSAFVGVSVANLQGTLATPTISGWKVTFNVGNWSSVSGFIFMPYFPTASFTIS